MAILEGLKFVIVICPEALLGKLVKRCALKSAVLVNAILDFLSQEVISDLVRFCWNQLGCRILCLPCSALLKSGLLLRNLNIVKLLKLKLGLLLGRVVMVWSNLNIDGVSHVLYPVLLLRKGLLSN